MKHFRLPGLAAAIVSVVLLAAFAGTATAAPAKAAATTAQAANTLGVRFAVTDFFVQKQQLFARGDVIASYVAADGTAYTTSTPFTTRVTSHSPGRATTAVRHVTRANRICSVLDLNIAPIHLELLGLIVDLDRVHLTVTADSNGGILGALLCGLAGNSSLATPATASQLTQAAQTSGLSSGAGFEVPLASSNVQPQALPPVPAGVCTVLDLPIGPLDLSLLGLMVHLDTVHLVITAEPGPGNLLGNLLCSVAHLLDDLIVGNALANLLNRIFALLG